MSTFLLSVVASLVGGVILVVLTALVSKRARWVLTGMLGRLLDVDIDAVFADKHEARADLEAELRRAHDVSILTGRGSELQREAFDPLFLHRPAAKPVRIRILLPRTTVSTGEYDWTWQRENEVAKFDSAFGKGLLREQIETNAQFLSEHAATADGKVEVRRFNYPHVGRIVLTERCGYYTPYRADSHGRDCTVYKFRRGEMYDNFVRMFEQLWEAEKP